jgi:hypothetical protein
MGFGSAPGLGPIGLLNMAPIVTAFMITLPVVATNVVQGVGSVDRRLLEMGQLYRLSGWEASYAQRDGGGHRSRPAAAQEACHLETRSLDGGVSRSISLGESSPLQHVIGGETRKNSREYSNGGMCCEIRHGRVRAEAARYSAACHCNLHGGGCSHMSPFVARRIPSSDAVAADVTRAFQPTGVDATLEPLRGGAT